MNILLNVWREFGAYLRYANSRNLALLTINASIITLITAWITSTTPDNTFAFLRPTLFCYMVIMIFLGSSQIVIFISFFPALNRARPRRSAWISVARVFRLITPTVPAQNRSPFFFGEVSQFESPADYFSNLRTYHQDIVEGIGQQPTARERELAIYKCTEQIWILSKLTATKFAQFAIALTFLWIAILYYVAYALVSTGRTLCPWT
jgi:hypothetical protein